MRAGRLVLVSLLLTGGQCPTDTTEIVVGKGCCPKSLFEVGYADPSVGAATDYELDPLLFAWTGQLLPVDVPFRHLRSTFGVLCVRCAWPYWDNDPRYDPDLEAYPGIVCAWHDDPYPDGVLCEGG